MAKKKTKKKTDKSFKTCKTCNTKNDCNLAGKCLDKRAGRRGIYKY